MARRWATVAMNANNTASNRIASMMAVLAFAATGGCSAHQTSYSSHAASLAAR